MKISTIFAAVTITSSCIALASNDTSCQEALTQTQQIKSSDWDKLPKIQDLYSTKGEYETTADFNKRTKLEYLSVKNIADIKAKQYAEANSKNGYAKIVIDLTKQTSTYIKYDADKKSIAINSYSISEKTIKKPNKIKLNQIITENGKSSDSAGPLGAIEMRSTDFGVLYTTNLKTPFLRGTSNTINFKIAPEQAQIHGNNLSLALAGNFMSPYSHEETLDFLSSNDKYQGKMIRRIIKQNNVIINLKCAAIISNRTDKILFELK